VSEVKHVVFDLGQVLIRWDPENAFRNMIPDDEERRAFLENVCSPEWNLEQDRGRSWSDAEAALIAKYPQHEKFIRAYRRRWWQMIPGAIEENVSIVEALIDRGIDVTALTNWAADTFEEAENRFAILSQFRGVTVSGRVKLVKPDPAIYDHHVGTFGLNPTETLFFDDNPDNVATARRMGWQAEQYVSTEKLTAALRRYGVAA